MRSVIQRVRSASVTIDGAVKSSIGPGLLILLGVQAGDTEADAVWLAQKIAVLRIFEDEEGRMNRSLVDQPVRVADHPEPAAPGTSSDLPPRGVLVVSQFTLIASTRKGTRPSFNDAARPPEAVPLYESFVQQLELAVGRPVGTGTFGAMMQVALVNDGPVTLVIDSRTRE